MDGAVFWPASRVLMGSMRISNFGPLQCKSKEHASEDSVNYSSPTRSSRCLWSCFLETSRRRNCIEKCIGRNKEGDFNSNARTPRITPHLATLSRRRKRNINEKSTVQCPTKAITNNVFPTLRTPERNQYENTDKWHLNISWYPIHDTTNFTGYGLRYWCDDGVGPFQGGSHGWITRQKSETYVVINGSQSCWNYNMTFRYNVIALPCLNGSGIDLIDLPWNSDLTSTSAIVSTTPTVPATNKVTIIVPTTPAVRATNKVTIIVPTIIIVAVLAAISMTMFLLYRKKQRSRSDSSRGDADYDAFIIFARDDQKWVDGTLLPILEKEFNYKCCVHYRDFIVGKDFVENMVDSVYTSRKVVAVMSKSFFSSKWCNFELQKAIYKNLNDGIVVIRIDNVSTEKFPKAIKKRSFIDYSNVVERQVFKTRLLKVLGNSNNVV
ncbi:uncharacterized protein LOC144665706 isoform X2 [Oculina patagonica]